MVTKSRFDNLEEVKKESSQQVTDDFLLYKDADKMKSFDELFRNRPRFIYMPTE
jgi:hypothetical protein